MDAKAELAEFVDDHLGQGKPFDPLLAQVVTGLAEIVNAITDAQRKLGNWGSMVGRLRTGSERVQLALPYLRDEPGFAELASFCDRAVSLASLVYDEILRVSADDPTLA